MKYLSFVESHLAQFAASSKIAQDLASLLDQDFFSPANFKTDVPGSGDRLAQLRHEVFEDLCRVCAKCGVPQPDLELGTLAMCSPVVLSWDFEELRKIIDHAKRQTSGGRAGCNESKDRIRILLQALEIMPGLAFKAELKHIRAALNADLMRLGARPIREAFPKGERLPYQLTMWSDREPPPRSLKALVVDDDARQNVRSVRAIIGYPGLAVSCLVPPMPEELKQRKGEEPEAFTERNRRRTAKLTDKLAQHIIGLAPDIILMDEGMYPFDGGYVILAIKRLKPDSGIAFVGNTGGSGDSLRKAGASLNYDKGQNPEPLLQAIRRFGRG